MDNIHDLLRQMGDGEETEDRTVYIRETAQGPKIDYEMVERTSFASAYPETVREFRSKQPLSCGHLVDAKTNPFGGYCQRRRLFRRESCGKEYCSLCAVQCPRCGIFVGASCCARSLDGVFYCRSCKRALSARRWLGSSLAFLFAPFLSESLPDD